MMIWWLSVLDTAVLIFLMYLWRTATPPARLGILFLALVLALNLLGWRSLS